MMHYSRLFWSSIIKFIPSLKIFRMLMKLEKKKSLRVDESLKESKKMFQRRENREHFLRVCPVSQFQWETSLTRPSK